jgi:hypothetical protein
VAEFRAVQPDACNPIEPGLGCRKRGERIFFIEVTEKQRISLDVSP